MAAGVAGMATGKADQAEAERRFEQLIQDHRGIVFKVANAYCREAEDRKDLAQEIVAQVWRAYPSYDEARRFSTWMYRIALNVAISFRRKAAFRERHTAAVDPVALANMADPLREPDPQVRELYRVIDTLDGLNRALVLLYLEGYDHKEIGFVLGISEANVATKLSRVRQRLREEIGGHRGTR